MTPAAALIAKADPELGAFIAGFGPMPRPRAEFAEPYHALLSAVAHQQLHARAALAIFGRLKTACGDCLPDPDALLALPDEALRACGFSANKAAAIRDVAAKAADGTIPSRARALRLGDEELIARLTTIRGVGRWTVEMLLIFRMGRPDVFPVTDYGVRKGFALTFQRVPKTRAIAAEDLPKPEVMLKRGKMWAPFRSVASWYLWRACDLAKNAPPAGRSAKG